MISISTTLKSHPEVLKSFSDSYDALLKRSDLGFTRLPKETHFSRESKALAAEIKQTFSHLVVVGIGGSSMGPRAIAEISGSNAISFLDNVDSVETNKVISKLDLDHTAWVFISKSGSTIEILWNLDLVFSLYTEKGKSFWDKTYYITEKTKNPLFDLSQEHKRPCLEIPKNVGGRFSVLSPVGLLIAEYLGMSSELILAGAQKALSSPEKISAACELYSQSFSKKEDITLFWFYNSNMRWFGCWIQQLWAESLGKKITRSGTPAPDFSTPVISIGTCDQHSIMQQVMDGPRNKFVNFFRFSNVEKSHFPKLKSHFNETSLLNNKNYGELIKAAAFGTEQAFTESGISCVQYHMNDLNEETLGFIFMFFQLVVATLGENYDVDAFNQPGVQLSKVKTMTILRES